MENVGQSESSPKILKCSHPYSSSVDFKVELGVCNNGWKYNLNFDARNNYVISRHNSEEHFVLNHNKYEITLEQWLVKEENQYNWCNYYETWGLYRPKEEAKKVIQGILRAVCELHSHNSFHGFLYYPENFAIQDNEVGIGGDHEKNKHIFLIHDNHKLHAFTNNSTQLGDRQRSDRHAVSDVIFTQILGNWQLPQDLQDLRRLLLKPKVTSHDWNLIVNHPSLWNWKSRFDYIDCVWMRFKHADGNSNERWHMKREFNKIHVMGWQNKIPWNSPLESVYKYNNVRYRETAEDLIHFIRNVRTHYKQHVERHHAMEYNEPQFIEVQITKLNELLLVKLYGIMC